MTSRTSRSIPRLPATLLYALLTVPVSAGEIYRWVDEAGRVHFGDKPPGNAERVEVAPTPAGDPGLQERRERSERLLDVMEEDRQRRDQEQAAVEKVEADRRGKCETARRRQSQAADARFIARPSDDPDNPRVLDEAERQEFEQRLQEEVRRYCGNPKASK